MSQVLAGKIAKAAYSGVVAFLGSLGASLSDSEKLAGVTSSQWVWIALATVVAAGGTFGLAGWAGPSSLGPPSKEP